VLQEGPFQRLCWLGDVRVFSGQQFETVIHRNRLPACCAESAREQELLWLSWQAFVFVQFTRGLLAMSFPAPNFMAQDFMTRRFPGLNQQQDR
jgi:hypothetical protein